MRKTLLLLSLVIMVVGCTKDEEDTTGSVYGKITNSINGELLQGATVTMSPGGISLVTGSDGSFECLDVQPGQYRLQAQKQGFVSNYKQITVVVGQTASGDLTLAPIQSNIDWQIAPTELLFGNSFTELTFVIKNTGTSGALTWNISGVDADWISVFPLSGTTAIGMSSTVRVSVNRELLKTESSTIITVNVPGGSSTVRISASPSN
ncbi:MAG: carboxypeptidase regulatory-like domain-containing protein [Paraprevotella sp.]|nr:carboxypeptidase regulatory-like domain-containing protein [Paraprevotella sp.]